jgi:hypothetical protein
MDDVASEFARVDEADGERFAVVAVLAEQGAGLLEKGAHLVLADVEEMGDQRGGQAALVQDGGPDDVLGGQLAVVGALPEWERVE